MKGKRQKSKCGPTHGRRRRKDRTLPRGCLGFSPSRQGRHFAQGDRTFTAGFDVDRYASGSHSMAISLFVGEVFIAAVLAIGALYLALALLRFLAGRVVCFTGRPDSYDRENARRRALRAERRRIRRRWTDAPCPSPADLLAQFARARDSPREMIRFGSLLEDLECYVDNSLRFDEAGDIVGREPGIRGWLRENCPELSARYKTVMRYKALAKRFKQLVEISDPVSAASVLERAAPPALRAARQRAAAFFKDCGTTLKDVRTALDRALDRARATAGPDKPARVT